MFLFWNHRIFIIEPFRSFQDIMIFESILESSKSFEIVKIFQNVRKYSRIFQNTVNDAEFFCKMATKTIQDENDAFVEK